MSSMRMISTLGASGGALTSNLGGGVVLRASSSMLFGYCGSGMGRVARSGIASALAVVAHTTPNVRPKDAREMLVFMVVLLNG